MKGFLTDHLPTRFQVDRGLVLASNEEFSNQADLVVVDGLNNAPLHSTKPHPIWPVESVYALVEVKTSLDAGQLRDAVAKGRTFKRLPRDFSESRHPKITDSLFVIWAFNGPRPTTVKANLVEILEGVPPVERPDLVVIPDQLVATSGHYLEISRLGQPLSSHRSYAQQEHTGDLGRLLPIVDVLDSGPNSLLVWFWWFHSWLMAAGDRTFNPFAYLGEGPFGNRL